MTQKPTHNKTVIVTGLFLLFAALACALYVTSGTPAAEADLTIKNPQEYPAVGGNWTVLFNTTGTADLWITAVNGTEFNKDLEFIEIRCGDETLNYELINNSILIRDYECSEISYETANTPKKEYASGGIKYLEYYKDTEDTPSVAIVSIEDQQENPYELQYLIDAGFFMGIKK